MRRKGEHVPYLFCFRSHLFGINHDALVNGLLGQDPHEPGQFVREELIVSDSCMKKERGQGSLSHSFDAYAFIFGEVHEYVVGWVILMTREEIELVAADAKLL